MRHVPSPSVRLGRVLLLAAAGFGLATAASAQGVLRGVVTDTLDGSTLPGANVIVEGTSLGAATDINGTYRLPRVPVGPQTVRVSYVGYETALVPVVIEDGETVVLDVALAPSAILGEVVVSGQLEGQQAAINQQLSSNTIVNVVSEEKIQELPDANAAESIGRLPGVSVQRSGGEANQITLRGLSGAFTNVTVDGVQLSPTDAASRSVDLSAISQGSLAGIELFKALLPSQDADAIAGSVNLVTRRAPRTRELRVDVLGSYNELASDAGQYDADFRYGERFLDGFLGVQLSGNLESRNRSSQEYDPSFFCEEANAADCEIQDLQLDYTDETRQRRGVGAILDVSTPDGGFVKLSGLFNQTSRDFITYGRNYPTNGDLVFYTARDREQTVRLFNSALTGENYLVGLNTTWGASYSRSESDFPFDYELEFTEPSTTDADGNLLSGIGRVPEEALTGEPEGIIPYAINNFDRAYLYSAFSRNEEASDDNLAAYLDLEREYTARDRRSPGRSRSAGSTGARAAAATAPRCSRRTTTRRSRSSSSSPTAPSCRRTSRGPRSRTWRGAATSSSRPTSSARAGARRSSATGSLLNAGPRPGPHPGVVRAQPGRDQRGGAAGVPGQPRAGGRLLRHHRARLGGLPHEHARPRPARDLDRGPPRRARGQRLRQPLRPERPRRRPRPDRGHPRHVLVVRPDGVAPEHPARPPPDGLPHAPGGGLPRARPARLQQPARQHGRPPRRVLLPQQQHRPRQPEPPHGDGLELRGRRLLLRRPARALHGLRVLQADRRLLPGHQRAPVPG